MSEIRCSIECREDATRHGPGRLVGRILTYGERALDRPEVFEAGALTWPSDGVVLNRQHARGAPIMRIVPKQVGNELTIDQPLPDTTAGRDAATEIRDGLLRGLSVSFQSARQSFAGGVRRIQSATMTAIGLVDDPSYDAPVEVPAARPQQPVSTGMAVMSAAVLRVALGADEALQGRIDSIYAACCARIKRYAARAPIAVRNEALIVYAAWIYQRGRNRDPSSRPMARDCPSTSRGRSC